MPVIPPYVDGASSEQERVAQMIRTRRGGHLLNIDRMLLHSVPFAEGYNAMLPKVRNELSLPDSTRELLICATAQLTGAAYEVHHHTPVFLRAGGTSAQVDALTRLGNPGFSAEIFSAEQRALLQFALESTRDVRVRPETIAELQHHFASPTQIAEIVDVVAVYNMVCRLVVSLGIEIEA